MIVDQYVANHDHYYSSHIIKFVGFELTYYAINFGVYSFYMVFTFYEFSISVSIIILLI